MSRRSLAVGILVLWLGALAWLFAREYRPRSQSDVLAAAVQSLPPGATYYALSLGGRQIGFASSMVDTLRDSIQVRDQMSLDIPVLGTVQHTQTNTLALLTRKLELRSFVATLQSEMGAFAARGTLSGDSVLGIDLESNGSTQHLRVPLRHPIVLPGLLPIRATFGRRLKAGSAFTMRIFDPLALEERDVAMRVTGDSTFIVPDSAVYDVTQRFWVPATFDTVRAWRVEQDMGGVSLAAWIDETGRVVLAQSPVGFTMQRSAFEIVYENYRHRPTQAPPPATGDLIDQTAIASNVRLEEVPRHGTLAVVLHGVRLAGFDLSGGRQELRGDTLVVHAETPDALRASYRLPASRPQLAKDLAAEPLIQVYDPRIDAEARQIVGHVHDPARAAQLLNQWVYDNLKKEITISVPSAVQVLEERRGDCNEHTVLYVALARAIGLPARTAAGLVYLRGRFYYHAWPEVYLNGWVAVDPTFGQFPADASHLRFTIGGLARQVELIRLIGQLQLNVVQR
jgi:Transglutaminase-like superfamily